MVKTHAQNAQGEAGSPVSMPSLFRAGAPALEGVHRRKSTPRGAVALDPVCRASQVPMETAEHSAPSSAAGPAPRRPRNAAPTHKKMGRKNVSEAPDVHSVYKRAHQRDSSPAFVAEGWRCPTTAAGAAAAPVPVTDFKESQKHGQTGQCADEAKAEETPSSARLPGNTKSRATSSDCIPPSKGRNRRVQDFLPTSEFTSACGPFVPSIIRRLSFSSKPPDYSHVSQKNPHSTRPSSPWSSKSFGGPKPDEIRSRVPSEVQSSAHSLKMHRMEQLHPSGCSDTFAANADLQRRLRFCQLILTYWCYASLYLTRKPFASARGTLQVELRLSTEAMGWIDTAFLLAYALMQLFLAPSVSALCHRRMRAFFLAAFACSSACCFYVALAPENMLRLQQLLFVWGLNGAAQALVFPFLVAILRQWLAELPGGGTGTFGVWSTCQQLGSMVASYVTGEVLSLLSPEVAQSPWLPFKRMLMPNTAWRSVFFIPAVIVLASGIALYAWLIESPADYVRENAESLATNDHQKRGTRRRQRREAQPRAKYAGVKAGDGSAVHGEILSYRKEGDVEPALGSLIAGSSVRRDLRLQSEARADPVLAPGVELSLMIKAGIPLLSGAYFCMKLVRYALISWLPLLLETQFRFSALETTLGANLFEMGGVAGAISVGYISQQFFNGRCFAVISVLCGVATSASLCLLRMLVNHSNRVRDPVSAPGRGIPLWEQLVFVVLGASIAGPDSVLGGMAAASAIGDVDFPNKHNVTASEASGKDKADDPKNSRKLIATASCIVNGSGSIGSVFQGPLTPLVISAYGWQGFLALLGCACAFSGILLVPLLLRDVKKVDLLRKQIVLFIFMVCNAFHHCGYSKSLYYAEKNRTKYLRSYGQAYGFAPASVLRDSCVGYTLGVSESSYTERDCILYALGVGCSQNPLDDKDLCYTYENHSDGFRVLPTFATTFPSFNTIFDGLQKCPGLPEFNPMMLLHGQHKLRLFRPLRETAETMRHTGVLRDVLDKKSGALVAIDVDSIAEDGLLICRNEFTLFIRGLGNFSRPSKATEASVRTVDSDIGPRVRVSLADRLTCDVTTPENLALIYRLSGDRNPLHVDKQMAAMGGFKRPILHGLCSFGIATKGQYTKTVYEACRRKTLLDNEPTKIRSISGRFTAPVTPGDELRVQMWSTAKEIHERRKEKKMFFEVVNRSTGDTVCLDQGVLTYTDDSFYARM